jgi:hypothetical protein
MLDQPRRGVEGEVLARLARLARRDHELRQRVPVRRLREAAGAAELDAVSGGVEHPALLRLIRRAVAPDGVQGCTFGARCGQDGGRRRHQHCAAAPAARLLLRSDTLRRETGRRCMHCRCWSRHSDARRETQKPRRACGSGCQVQASIFFSAECFAPEHFRNARGKWAAET